MLLDFLRSLRTTAIHALALPVAILLPECFGALGGGIREFLSVISERAEGKE